MNSLKPIDMYHRVGKYYISNGYYTEEDTNPFSHYVIDSETGITTKLSGMEIYNMIKSNPDMQYVNGIKYTHFDIYSLLNPSGYSTRKEMIIDIFNKEPQEARMIRQQEYLEIIAREKELTNKYYGNTYEERLKETKSKRSDR